MPFLNTYLPLAHLPNLPTSRLASDLFLCYAALTKPTELRFPVFKGGGDRLLVSKVLDLRGVGDLGYWREGLRSGAFYAAHPRFPSFLCATLYI